MPSVPSDIEEIQITNWVFLHWLAVWIRELLRQPEIYEINKAVLKHYIVLFDVSVSKPHFFVEKLEYFCQINQQLNPVMLSKRLVLKLFNQIRQRKVKSLNYDESQFIFFKKSIISWNPLRDSLFWPKLLINMHLIEKWFLLTDVFCYQL
jgi:hypothetical protein